MIVFVEQNMVRIDSVVLAVMLSPVRNTFDVQWSPPYENMTSSIKPEVHNKSPEVHNISQHSQMRTEPQP